MKNKKSFLVLVLLLLLLGVGSFTYARYITEYNGTGTAEVAKWAVALKQNGAAVSETFNLNFALEENEHVADGKIAPGRSAIAKLQLDLTGTEVSADYSFDFSNVTGLPAGVTVTDVRATVGGNKATLSEYDGVYTGTLLYSDSNKVVDLEVVLEWEDVTANNASDTAAGKAATALTIPVKVVIEQHLRK